MNETTQLFELGDVQITEPTAQIYVSPDFIDTCLSRHQSGDYGDASSELKSANNKNILGGGQIRSRYRIPNTQLSILVVTEADKKLTWIMTP